MNLKQAVENHPLAFVAIVAIGSFAGGWSAHMAVQSASGLAAVPADKVKQVEMMDQERSQNANRISQLEAERHRLAEGLDELRRASSRPPTESAPKHNDTTAKPTAATPPTRQDRTLPQGQLSTNGNNLPVTVGDLQLVLPKSGAFKVDDEIKVTFAYVISPGNAIRFWVYPRDDNDLEYSYEPSGEVTGSGQLTRYFVLSKPGTVKEIQLWAAQGRSDRAQLIGKTQIRIDIK